MITQIKLSDGLIWQAVPTEGDSSRRFTLIDSQHNRDNWADNETKFGPGQTILRHKAIIVGHIHSEAEQKEIEGRNNRAARHRNEEIRLAHFNTVLPARFRV